jgi:thiamine pyrophosphate-dependent acetolactate synthase large subunit-like protein
MGRSICQALLDILAEAGARDVFGMTGDVLNPLLDASARTTASAGWACATRSTPPTRPPPSRS